MIGRVTGGGCSVSSGVCRTIRSTGTAGRAGSEINVVRRGPLNGGVRPERSLG